MEKLKGYRFGPIFTPPSKPPQSQGTLQLPSYVGGANWGSAAVDPDKGIQYVRADNFINRPLFGDGLYVNKPPYTTITAIDLNKGEILWQEPNGDMPAIRNNPLLKGVSFPPTGAFGRAGPMVTAGGLVFIGAEDKKIYARDKDNGKVIWAGDLKYPAGGNPMTYRTRSGKQFVVVATGNAKDSTLVAFALP